MHGEVGTDERGTRHAWHTTGVESIGIVAVAVGRYSEYLPAWANAVAALQTPPTQITVVTDTSDTAVADEALPGIQWITPKGTWQHHPQVLVNEAIEETGTDWICKMDADDLIYPHSFDQLNGHPADVLCFGIQAGARNLYPNPVTAGLILATDHNLVFSGSPYRRWVWQRSRYRDMIYEDWAFWIDAAKNKAKFAPSGRIDYEYGIHPGQVSETADKEHWHLEVRKLRCGSA